MIDYHANLVLKIDLILLASYFVFAIMLIVYVILRDSRSEKRIRSLLKIKESLERQFLSGENSKASVNAIRHSTPSEFLDVVTNRRKYTIFFNGSEQRIFKECFITPERIKALTSLVRRSRNKWRKVEAIMALGYTQDDPSLKILEKTLYYKDEDISYFSALAIGQINTMRSVTILMNFLKANPVMRRKTASILESLSPDITDEVIKFADDADPEVRVWAVRLLSRAANKEYIKKVEESAKDASSDVRAAACESLAKLEDKNSKHILLKCMKDDIWFVRMHAVRALSGLFGKESLPQIIELLNDGSLMVLDSVRQALADNIDAARPYIHKIAEGTDELAKKICKEAMEESALKGADKTDKI